MSLSGPLSPERIAERLDIRDAARAAGAVGAAGAHRENPVHAPSPSDDLTAAAVLVPLVRREDGLTVLLTQRTDHLDNHPGQISFPGGRIEDHDPTPEAAALRETEEEVGVPVAAVETIGRLDDYVTGTGFTVVPVVGLVHPPFTVRPDPFEVADVFEVPLAFLMNPDNHLRHLRRKNGHEWRFYAMPFENRFIWGATAGMMRNFYEILAGEAAAPPPDAVVPTPEQAALSPLRG
jgi:8-oxo-dGTP pyrophosphatase MutT (NUDIX family)